MSHEDNMRGFDRLEELVRGKLAECEALLSERDALLSLRDELRARVKSQEQEIEHLRDLLCNKADHIADLRKERDSLLNQLERTLGGLK